MYLLVMLLFPGHVHKVEGSHGYTSHRINLNPGQGISDHIVLSFDGAEVMGELANVG